MRVEDWLGSENTLGIDIWNKKYRYEDETFDEWLDRVSGGDCVVKDLILNKKFLFGGRILSNRGLQNRDRKVSLSNCYVMDPPEDNIESIFDCTKKLARTYSYGGGCGVDISKLSPRGAKINNAAKRTTGAVSFMDLYSLITELIGAEGRRSALMLSISCDHPDLEEFINVKSDLNRVTKANISIRITDEFMQAVIDKRDYELSFTREETGETITKTVNAYDIFRKICEMNWDYAEPGMLFWDEISRYSLLSEDERFSYSGVNPCFDGSMELLTKDGYKTFEELCGTEPEIYNADGKIVKSRVWCSGELHTVIVKTDKGELICTPNHLFLTEDGESCEARNLCGKHVKTFSGDSAKVVSVTDFEKRKVYDFTEPETHWGVVNGCIVHNCAEGIWLN